MVRHLRRRLSRLWDHLQSVGKRGRLVVDRLLDPLFSPPPVSPEAKTERLKQITTVLTALSVGAFAASITTPLLTDPPALRSLSGVGFAISGLLFLAGRRVLRYIPRKTDPKEIDQ